MQLSLCGVVRTQVVGKCSHILLGGKRKGKRCNRKAYYLDKAGKQLCAEHRKKLPLVEVSFPLDCLTAIVSHMEKADWWPLIFVCKSWKDTIKLPKDVHPLDTYLGLHEVEIPIFSASITVYNPSTYPSSFVDWALQMKWPASQGVVRFVHDTQFMKRLRTLIMLGFPVTDESANSLSIRYCMAKTPCSVTGDILDMLDARGCEFADEFELDDSDSF
jgi:hypothetical protein